MIAFPSRSLSLLLAIGCGVVLTHAGEVALGQASVAGGLRGEQSPAQRLSAVVKQIGIHACAPVFEQAGSFLFENGKAQFVAQPLGPDPDRWPTAVTAESNHPGATPRAATQTRLTTLVVAPAGSCSGLYQQVIYWPESCAALKTRVFGTFKGERPLLEHVRQSEANPGLQLYLMPAGAGCVSVKKELIG